MKVAVVGSRSLSITDLERYLPKNTTHIISGGAKGIDQCAKNYAIEHQLQYTELLPDYHRYGKGAPLKRNDQIIAMADRVVIFWDGVSRGTRYTLQQCEKQKIPFTLHSGRSVK